MSCDQFGGGPIESLVIRTTSWVSHLLTTRLIRPASPFYIAPIARGDIFLSDSPILIPHTHFPVEEWLMRPGLRIFPGAQLGLVAVICLMTCPLGLKAAHPPAPEEEDAPRPTIGVALGGGGARGAAHVGVLQALQEMNIPIDFVSGTSMGSVVGSLFCIGLSPEEIEVEMSGVDWDDLFSDRPRRQDRTFRRKEDDTSFFLPVEFGWKDEKVAFSSGIIAGQKLAFAFPHKSLVLGGRSNFDDLAYPFRPVATDLRTGEMVVLERGNLLKAVRASMSIPGVFPPVKWGQHILVDGYLSRNLPVDVVRNMGADIVIAVNVGADPAETDPAQFQNFLGVNAQQGLLLAHRNVAEQLPLADIVINVDLEDIQPLDFKRVADAIPLGRKAARNLAEQLEPLALSPEEYENHLLRHRLIEPDLLTIDEIILHNHSQVDDRAILRSIHQEIGRPLDLEQLKDDVVRLYDFGVFQLVDFEVLRDAKGNNHLHLTVNEKYYSPNILNFGVTYSGGDEGRSFLETRLRLTRLEMNRFGSELRTDLQLGRTNGIRSEWHQPLSMTRRPFLAVAARWRNRYQDWYLAQFHLGELQTEDLTGFLDLGYRLGRSGELRVGVEYGHLRAADKTNLHFYEFENDRGGYTASLDLDELDSSIMPRSGYRLSGRAFWGRPELGGNLDYARVHARASLVRSLGADTFTLNMAGGSALHTDLPEFAAFTLGGPENLEGYQPDSLRGDVFGLLGLRWYRQIKGHPSPYSTSWYLGTRIEAGNVWPSHGAMTLDKMKLSASVSLTVKTIMGPLTLSIAQGDGGRDALSATLGGVVPFLE